MRARHAQRLGQDTGRRELNFDAAPHSISMAASSTERCVAAWAQSHRPHNAQHQWPSPSQPGSTAGVEAPHAFRSLQLGIAGLVATQQSIMETSTAAALAAPRRRPQSIGQSLPSARGERLPDIVAVAVPFEAAAVVSRGSGVVCSARIRREMPSRR